MPLEIENFLLFEYLLYEILIRVCLSYCDFLNMYKDISVICVKEL